MGKACVGLNLYGSADTYYCVSNYFRYGTLKWFNIDSNLLQCSRTQVHYCLHCSTAFDEIDMHKTFDVNNA